MTRLVTTSLICLWMPTAAFAQGTSAPAPDEPSGADASPRPPAAVLAPAPVPGAAPAATPRPPGAQFGDPGASPATEEWEVPGDSRMDRATRREGYYGRRVERDERPRRLPYDGGSPPRGYRLISTSVKALWIPGLAVAGGTYAISLLLGSIPDGEAERDRLQWLALPILGPWVALAQGCNERPPVDFYDDGTTCPFPDNLLVLSGVLQAAGLVALIAGLTMERQYFVRVDYSELRLRPSQVGHRAYGLTLGGQF